MPALPLPLSTICELACETSLLPRVRMAIALTAREVFSEGQDTPGYPLRWNLAKSLLSPTEAQAMEQMVGIVTSPSILAAAASAAAAGATNSEGMAAGITDEQLLDAVRANWDAVAGVNPAPAQPET
ncbi:hypothetical protein AB0G49_14030 [Streptomyces longwoodensis]|uniref:hypothetical protein n=1 Tax=Streptomyces longwoodensis TaxID=68231 RepID=UPI0033F369E1